MEIISYIKYILKVWFTFVIASPVLFIAISTVGKLIHHDRISLSDTIGLIFALIAGNILFGLIGVCIVILVDVFIDIEIKYKKPVLLSLSLVVLILTMLLLFNKEDLASTFFLEMLVAYAIVLVCSIFYYDF